MSLRCSRGLACPCRDIRQVVGKRHDLQIDRSVVVEWINRNLFKKHILGLIDKPIFLTTIASQTFLPIGCLPVRSTPIFREIAALHHTPAPVRARKHAWVVRVAACPKLKTVCIDVAASTVVIGSEPAMTTQILSAEHCVSHGRIEAYWRKRVLMDATSVVQVSGCGIFGCFSKYSVRIRVTGCWVGECTYGILTFCGPGGRRLRRFGDARRVAKCGQRRGNRRWWGRRARLDVVHLAHELKVASLGPLCRVVPDGEGEVDLADVFVRKRNRPCFLVDVEFVLSTCNQRPRVLVLPRRPDSQV